jgi:hypothetical protein
MPVQYERDDTNRRIRLTLTDPVTVDALIASVERQLADGAWRYGLLIDTRAPIDAPRPTDIRSVASHIGELVAAHGPRGPIAIVAKSVSAIGSAQLHAFFGRAIESIEVFWDIDDAKHWLDARAKA